jgi:hypothetical protein
MDAVQKICKQIGESGCYFVCLLHLVNRDDDAIKLYKESVANGGIKEDCFVISPQLVLETASGKKFEVKYAGQFYKAEPDEFQILRFERKCTGTTYAHFVVGAGKGNVVFDPLGDSQTVKYGQVVSQRIIKEVV